MIDRRKFLMATAGGIVCGGRSVLADTSMGAVFHAKGPGYETGRTTFNSRFSRRPDVVAACTTEKGVLVSMLHAHQEKLPVAVKSGTQLRGLLSE